MMTNIKELLGNGEQLKLHWRSITFYIEEARKTGFHFLCERRGKVFLREEVCLFLDWRVKESWRAASSEREQHGRNDS